MSTPWQVPWPAGTVARYWTIAGATADVIDNEDGAHWRYDTVCTGCPWKNAFMAVAEEQAHRSAQAHAEKCRALPRPAQAQ